MKADDAESKGVTMAAPVVSAGAGMAADTTNDGKKSEGTPVDKSETAYLLASGFTTCPSGSICTGVPNLDIRMCTCQHPMGYGIECGPSGHDTWHAHYPDGGYMDPHTVLLARQMIDTVFVSGRMGRPERAKGSHLISNIGWEVIDGNSVTVFGTDVNTRRVYDNPCYGMTVQYRTPPDKQAELITRTKETQELCFDLLKEVEVPARKANTKKLDPKMVVEWDKHHPATVDLSDVDVYTFPRFKHYIDYRGKQGNPCSNQFPPGFFDLLDMDDLLGAQELGSPAMALDWIQTIRLPTFQRTGYGPYKQQGCAYLDPNRFSMRVEKELVTVEITSLAHTYTLVVDKYKETTVEDEAVTISREVVRGREKYVGFTDLEPEAVKCFWPGGSCLIPLEDIDWAEATGSTTDSGD